MAWDIDSGTTASFESGSRTYGAPLNLAGELNAGGEINLTDQYSSGVGVTAGGDLSVRPTALSTSPLTLSAGSTLTGSETRIRSDGVAFDAGAVATFRRSTISGVVAMSGGATLTASETRTRTAQTDFSAGSTLVISGTTFATSATLGLESGADLAIDGVAIRTSGQLAFDAGGDVATVGTRISSSALEIEADADLFVSGLVIIPARRTDDASLLYDTSEDFELGLDS